IEGAEDAYRRALELRSDDDNMRSLLGLGALYVNQKRYQEAILVYQRALKARPEQAEIHVGLGLLYAGQGQRDQAARSFARAGELFLDGNKNDQALEAYRRAVRLAPTSSDLKQQLRRAEKAAARRGDGS